MLTPKNDWVYFKCKDDIRRYFKNRDIPYDINRINKVFNTNYDYKGYYFYNITTIDDLYNLFKSENNCTKNQEKTN